MPAGHRPFRFTNTPTNGRFVVQRMRERRILLRISQEALSEAIGITIQQLHKYEKASNRVSASRLYEIAIALDAPISYFFEGASKLEKKRAPII
jgi:transcriptional regulator with XRE-family HTH domain